jgi:hypothetical protein
MRKNVSIAAAAAVLLALSGAAFAQPAPDSAANRFDQSAVSAPTHQGAWAYYANETSASTVQPEVPHQHR